MTDTDKLEPGWYWVKWVAGCVWEPAEFCAGLWVLMGEEGFSNRQPAVVGPRLTPPEE